MKQDRSSSFGRFYDPRSLRLPGDLKRPCHQWDDSVDQVYCSELGEKTSWANCLSCDNSMICPRDGVRICRYEYEDLQRRGYYDGTWDEHPENFDPETWERLQQERENNQRVRRELEQDWERLEPRRREIRKLLESQSRSTYLETDEEDYDDTEDDDEEEDD